MELFFKQQCCQIYEINFQVHNNSALRSRAERARRATLEQEKLRATSALSLEDATSLKALFSKFDRDCDGVVKLALLPAMFQELQLAARSEQVC